MEEYLKEIEFAVNPVLQAIWHEHDELGKITNEYRTILDEIMEQGNKKDSLGRQLFDPKTIESLDRTGNEMKKLKDKIATRRFAIGALSGTLLQFAKQGISLAHGNCENCPEGPAVGSQSLKSVIWNARNHSIHWEEKKPHQFVRNSFRLLSLEFGLTHFGMFHTSNVSYSIIKLLGWKTFEDFKTTMLYLR